MLVGGFCDLNLDGSKFAVSLVSSLYAKLRYCMSHYLPLARYQSETFPRPKTCASD